MKKVVVISAVWCPSCLILKKHLKKIVSEYPNVEIETLDYDFDEDEVKKYDVSDKLPVIISMTDNNENGRLVGEKDYTEILEFLKSGEIIWKRDY